MILMRQKEHCVVERSLFCLHKQKADSWVRAHSSEVFHGTLFHQPTPPSLWGQHAIVSSPITTPASTGRHSSNHHLPATMRKYYPKEIREGHLRIWCRLQNGTSAQKHAGYWDALSNEVFKDEERCRALLKAAKEIADKPSDPWVIALEEINPHWSLFDFHSSVSCLEVQVFLSEPTERGFSVDWFPQIPEKRCNGTGVLSSLVPSSISKSQNNVSEREKEKEPAKPLYFHSGTLQVNSDDTASDGKVSLLFCV